MAAGLAQIGEFSFILAGLGVALGLLPAVGMSLGAGGCLDLDCAEPLLFAAIAPLQTWLLKRSNWPASWKARRPFAELPMSTERKYLEGQVVLVGYGQVGRGIAKALAAASIPASWPSKTGSWWNHCATRALPPCRATQQSRKC